MATDRIAAQLKSDLMRDFGLTDAQAAGVVGNLMHESGGFQQLQERNPSVKGSEGGYGYAQWTGPRRDKFEQYAKARGLEPGSYEANYGYLKYELANDPYERRQFNTVKKAQTAEEAARLVSENFLRPGKPNLAERTRLAQQAMSYAPVPPSDIPSAVATQLDVTRTAPTPATQTPDMRLMRNPMMSTTAAQASQFSGDPGTPADGQVVATIPSAPVPPPLAPFDASRNIPRPNADGSISTEVSRTVQFPDGTWGNVPSLWWGEGSQVRDFGTMGDDQLSDFAQRYEQRAGQRFPRYSTLDQAETAAQNRSNNGAGTTSRMTRPVFGQMGTPDVGAVYSGVIPSAPQRQQFSASDRVRGSNGYQTIASIPSTPQPQQVSASDLARGRSGISTIASIPSVPQPSNISASDMARGNNAWQTIASIPSSPIGQPPATRTVQNVPVTPQRPMSYAGQDRAPSTIQLPSLPALPPLQGFDNPNKGQERLAANAFPAAPGGDATALTPLSAFMPTPQLPAFPPITPMAVQPQMAMPPLPRPRPQIVQRPMQQMPQRPVARPLMAGGLAAMPQAPMRVVVQGANPINVANHSPEQLAAMQSGRDSYSGSNGAVMPVYAMNGKLRYSYGD